MEKDRQLAQALQTNAAQWGLDNITVINAAFPTAIDASFDLICLDPPFKQGLADAALNHASTLLKPDGIVALEHEPGLEIPPQWQVVKATKAGQEHLKLLEYHGLS